jgi:hypothetical protein
MYINRRAPSFLHLVLRLGRPLNGNSVHTLVKLVLLCSLTFHYGKFDLDEVQVVLNAVQKHVFPFPSSKFYLSFHALEFGEVMLMTFILRVMNKRSSPAQMGSTLRG